MKMTSVFDISETFRNFIALIDVANQNLLEDEFVKKMKIVTKKSTAENEKIVEEISIESKFNFGSVIHKLARPEFVQFKRLLRSWTRLP